MDSSIVSSTLPFCTMGKMMASLVSNRLRYASFSSANEYLGAVLRSVKQRSTGAYTNAYSHRLEMREMGKS